MTRAVRIDQNGGPEVLKIVDVTVGDPGPGEIRIRHKAVGLNFIDVYQRTGLYPLPMPLNLGMEASGVVEAVRGVHAHAKRSNSPRSREGVHAATLVVSALTRDFRPRTVGLHFDDVIAHGLELGAAPLHLLRITVGLREREVAV